MLYFKAIFLRPKQCFFTYFDTFHSLRQEEIYQVTKCPVFPLRNDGIARAGRGWEGLSAITFHVQPYPSLDLRPTFTRRQQMNVRSYPLSKQPFNSSYAQGKQISGCSEDAGERASV